MRAFSSAGYPPERPKSFGQPDKVSLAGRAGSVACTPRLDTIERTVSSAVEHCIHIAGVAGSNPASSTTYPSEKATMSKNPKSFFALALPVPLFIVQFLANITNQGLLSPLPNSNPEGFVSYPSFQVEGASVSAKISLPSPTPPFEPSPRPTLRPTPSPSPTPTPTPTTSPTPQPVSPAKIDEYFSLFSSQYQVDIWLLRRMAICESGYNYLAINGVYEGMFQFAPNTWIATRQRMVLDTNPDLRLNPEEAIRTAAFKISQDGTSAWPHCQE